MVVLAALDDTSTAWSVLAMAEQLGDLLGARVRAVHMRAAGAGVPTRLAGIGVPLDVVRGAVVPGIVAAAAQRDVAALVIGARNKGGTGPVLGSTASGVAAAIGKPAMVVPPNADPTVQLRRVLVPLDATLETSLAARPWVESALDAGLEVTALHVLTPDPRPAFTEPLRDRDFLARYCPWGNGAVELVTRIGRTDELVPAVAWEYAADLIVLGWSAELVWGRAPVVQAVLGRSPVPALLVPLPAAQTTAAALRRISSGPEPLLGPAPGSGG
jgi:nucleotide-binding universal stress UspA family protein